MSGSLAVYLNDVRFGWRKGQPDVIDLARFELHRGEHLFIEGPSGCGKSTLLGLLGGVHTPRAGRIQVLGQQLDRLSASERDRFRADHIGFIFQMFNLVPYLSMAENVLLPCRFSRERRRRVLSMSGSLGKQAEQLLRDLDLTDASLLSRPVTELSIGQQQRVAAARALIGAPEIVIADEPTSALDEGSRERFLELLFEQCNRLGTTLVFVSHDHRLGALFDRCVAFAEINRVRQPR